ncbi:retrotransposon protein, putative, ty1-copia subclass [Tanacetum coccineum]
MLLCYITDDFSRYGYAYLIKHKSDTFEVFKRYQNKVENQLGKKIKLTPPRKPQLNGVAEKRNRTLLDMVRSMMKSVDEKPIVNTDTQQEVVKPVKPDDISLPICRTSGRVSKHPQFYYGFHIEEDKISDSTLSELDEPVNYKEAMASLEAAKWKEAMKSKIQSMYYNQVWNLVEIITFLKTVGCKWIFKKKTSMDGKVHTYRASGSVVVILVLYVDDILLIGNDIPTLQSVKDWLGKCFAMIDLGDETYILGIKIYTDRSKRLIGLTMTWKSLKQDTVADFTCESEYIAAYEASKEAIWMKNFIEDLGVVPTVQDPIEIFFDNESVVALTKEPKDHGKSKHIERKYHFVRSKVEEGHVIVKHIRSEDNPADPFTKALAKSRHDEHARSIGLKDNIKF